MKLTFSTKAWDEYLYWQTTDKKILKRINLLIKDIQRTPNEGIGKPEPLNLDPAVKPREIAASTGALGYGKKVLFTNKVTTNFFPTPITPLATTLPTSSTAESRLKHRLSGYWSRRINDEHRIVYKQQNGSILIAQLRYHYGTNAPLTGECSL